MADLLPSGTDVDADADAEPRVVGLDSDDADDLLSALSSDTARRVLDELHDDPDTPSALADRVDTSLQNVQYHLSNLADAGLVEVAGTAYSEKGREMKVYAPADGPLVVVAGGDDEAAGLRTALARLVGGVAVLGVASVVLDRVARRGLPLPATSASGGDAVAPTDAGGSGGDALNVTEATRTAVEGGDAATSGTPTPSPSLDVHGATTAARTTDAGGGASIAEVTATPAATGTPTAAPTATATQTATASSDATHTIADSAGGGFAAFDVGAVTQAVAASPGLLFFLGGAAVLAGGFAYWYWRR